MNGILTDIDGDLQIENGTLVLGEITQQSIEFLLRANAGEFKSEPALGAGIDRVRGASEHYARLWATRAEAMLRSIGISVNDIEVTQTGLQVS